MHRKKRFGSTKIIFQNADRSVYGRKFIGAARGRNRITRSIRMQPGRQSRCPSLQILTVQSKPDRNAKQ